LAYKPGSVSQQENSYLLGSHSSWARCYHLPHATHPGDWLRKSTAGSKSTAHRPYSVLLPVGFTMPCPLLVKRWALTPPFHPYLLSYTTQRMVKTGGLLSVALIPKVTLAGRYPAPFCVKPGLSSPTAFRLLIGAATQPTDVDDLPIE